MKEGKAHRERSRVFHHYGDQRKRVTWIKVHIFRAHYNVGSTMDYKIDE
jgi:hypothetical protein